MLEHRVRDGMYLVKETVYGFIRTDRRWITRTLQEAEADQHTMKHFSEKIETLKQLESADKRDFVCVTGDTSCRGNGLMVDKPEWQRDMPTTQQENSHGS